MIGMVVIDSTSVWLASIPGGRWLVATRATTISTAVSTTVMELAEIIWKKIVPQKPFRYVSDTPFEHDVQLRQPDCTKATRVLGFDASTSLETMLDEVIPWIKNQIDTGGI